MRHRNGHSKGNGNGVLSEDHVPCDSVDHLQLQPVTLCRNPVVSYVCSNHYSVMARSLLLLLFLLQACFPLEYDWGNDGNPRDMKDCEILGKCVSCKSSQLVLQEPYNHQEVGMEGFERCRWRMSVGSPDLCSNIVVR